jgi:hypothetical protein
MIPRRATDRLALGLVALALLFVVWHATWGFFSAWTPNLGASAIEIAATIAIVDRIVRRETAREHAPVEAVARNALVEAMEGLAAMGGTTGAVIERVRDAISLAEMGELELWMPHHPIRYIDQAVALVGVAQRANAILEPELVVAVEKFSTDLFAARLLIELADEYTPTVEKYGAVFPDQGHDNKFRRSRSLEVMLRGGLRFALTSDRFLDHRLSTTRDS